MYYSKRKRRYNFNKILTIQRGFRDVSGYVLAALQSKTENANIQAMLYDICSKTTPAASPACSKLATIDFDLFYNSSHNTLSDLQTLNIEVLRRKTEICGILYNVRKIKSVFNCQYPNLIENCDKCIITEKTATTDAVFDCSNSKILDINNIGGLEYSLEQLSPLFESNNEYKTLLSAAIQQLSEMVETPLTTNFASTESNIRLINIAIRNISDLLGEFG